MTSLDEKIKIMMMRLREFCPKKGIEAIKINSAREGYYSFPLLKLEKSKRVILAKIIFLLNLNSVYAGCWYNNNKRSGKDKKYKIKFVGEDPETIYEIEMSFPEKDKFFREDYKCPLYYPRELNIDILKKEVNNQLETYKTALDFWEKQIKK